MLLTTNIDEIKEIKKNNIAVALVIGTLAISIAMIATEPLKTFLKSFVSAPVISGDFKEPFMNGSFLLQGSIELLISLLASVFIFLYSFKLYDLSTKNIDETKELKGNNLAVAIQVSSFIFSIMLIVKASLLPSFDALSKALEKNITAGAIFVVVLKITLFFILAAVIAFIVLWLVMSGFKLINSNLKDKKEIKKENVAVAVAIGVLLISSAILVEHGVVTLLSAFI